MINSNTKHMALGMIESPLMSGRLTNRLNNFTVNRGRHLPCRLEKLVTSLSASVLLTHGVDILNGQHPFF